MNFFHFLVVSPIARSAVNRHNEFSMVPWAVARVAKGDRL